MKKNLKKNLLALVVFMVLVISLPVLLYLVGKRQDIRPYALTGSASLLLTTDNVNQQIGNEFQVWSSMRLNDPANKLRVSGADFVLLYDKNKLEVLSVNPVITSTDPSAAFTDAPVVMKDGNFDDTYNYIRVALAARRPTSELKGGTVSLARIRFKTKGNGQASIKYPDDNKYFEVVGISLP